ncbi:hypothetical protein [Hymenobacter canadensis]|uniref:Copper resistance protein NlpE n=1 Tax=Hymenobacter canadensis TaxID=2999067 RepID=A0ABY7LPI5_9BACT|nr:hypothetical protein [Hymenobacter canadensis]WBA41801.1 hypothetical protein O3303_18565 [Hymenobacter canadensis]
MRLILLVATLLAAAGCERPEARLGTEATDAPNTASSAEAVYAGTYTVQDTAVCALSIIVTRRGGNGYFYSSEGVTGKVDITKEGIETYFTFVGLKGQEPPEDISATWQDSVLLIQNYGNSMNEYTRFGGCDAKYLELRRQ